MKKLCILLFALASCQGLPGPDEPLVEFEAEYQARKELGVVETREEYREKWERFQGPNRITMTEHSVRQQLAFEREMERIWTDYYRAISR